MSDDWGFCSVFPNRSILILPILKHSPETIADHRKNLGRVGKNNTSPNFSDLPPTITDDRGCQRFISPQNLVGLETAKSSNAWDFTDIWKVVQLQL